MLVNRCILFSIILSLELYRHLALPFHWSRNDTFWRYSPQYILEIPCLRAVYKFSLVSRLVTSDDLEPSPNWTGLFILTCHKSKYQVWKVSIIPIFICFVYNFFGYWPLVTSMTIYLHQKNCSLSLIMTNLHAQYEK